MNEWLSKSDLRFVSYEAFAKFGLHMYAQETAKPMVKVKLNEIFVLFSRSRQVELLMQILSSTRLKLKK